MEAILESGINGTELKVATFKDGLLIKEVNNNKESIFLTFEQFELIKDIVKLTKN